MHDSISACREDLYALEHRRDNMDADIDRLHRLIERMDPNSHENCDAINVLVPLVRALLDRERTRDGTAWRAIADSDVREALNFALEYLRAAKVVIHA